MGLPVYNGARYLRESIDSILAQTYPDFELIISDNASTDETEAICREYAKVDGRVRYYRNPENIGGFANHNRVVGLARGEFFMWAAHDDVRAPDYLRSCVEVLERRPEVVLCYSATRSIDAAGRDLAAKEAPLRIDAEGADARFREMTRMDYRLEPIYGLVRLDVLRRTGLEGQFADSDRVLLAELALHGPFHRVPRDLFFRRDHEERSIRSHPGRHQRVQWIRPRNTPRFTFPFWRQLAAYLQAIRRAGLPWSQRRRCYAHMAGWLREHRHQLLGDLEHAARELLSPVKQAARRIVRRRA